MPIQCIRDLNMIRNNSINYLNLVNIKHNTRKNSGSSIVSCTFLVGDKYA